MSDPATDQGSGLISERDFALVAARLKEMTGIHLGPHKRAMVSGRLAKRLKALGLSDYQSYVGVLEDGSETAEHEAFITALTTNMTRFRREKHHFRHFSEKMLPDLVTTARKGGRVRIWSAACSTGEEAYDLAFHVLDKCPEAAKLDLRLLATDIDKTALATAHDGIYPSVSLNDLPEGFRSTFFIEGDTPTGSARVCDEARSLIAFRSLNLDAVWPFKGLFDVVVCRNVAIYFDEATSDRLWHRLAAVLRPGGALYAGHSEALPKDVVDAGQQDGPGTYRFPDGFRAGQAKADQVIDSKEKPNGFERQASRSCG